MFDINFEYCNGNIKFEIDGIIPTEKFIEMLYEYDCRFLEANSHEVKRWLEETLSKIISRFKGEYILYDGNLVYVDTICSMYLPDEVRLVLNIENSYTKEPYRIINVSDEDLFYLKLKYDHILIESPFDFYKSILIKEVYDV